MQGDSSWQVARTGFLAALVLGLGACGLASDDDLPPPAPVITAFTASAVVVDAGATATLTARFQHGVGAIDQGVGVVASGQAVQIRPPADTTYTLTVRNAAGASEQATLSLTVRAALASQATGSLVQARYHHTATRLADGRVLLVGGMGDDYSVRTTAELYDPVTGTSEMTGAPAHARYAHTATLLADGRVLVAGGQVGAPAVAVAELYDPGTGLFSMAGTMVQVRAWPSASLLPDGRVLVIGGVNTGTNVIHASAEIYDPATGEFRPTLGSMSVPRLAHTAIVLPSGDVAVAGGDTHADDVLRIEQFDLVTETFAPAGSLLTARSLQSMTLLREGRVLIVAGTTPRSPFTFIGSAEAWDPVERSCVPVLSYPGTLRAMHSATLLADGRVVIVGGEDPSGALASAQVFDPLTQAFRPAAGGLLASRASHAATLLSDGRVLVSGGRAAGGTLASQELIGASP